MFWVGHGFSHAVNKAIYFLGFSPWVNSRDNVLGADNQQERSVEEFWVGHGFSRDITMAILRALAPEVGVLKIKTEILRDYMPDSNECVCWKRYSPNCMATCREWQKCPLRLVWKNPSAAKAVEWVSPGGTSKLVPFPKITSWREHRGSA
jgi:hypothetical protein